MANKKFSDFTQKTSTADVDFVVGYDGSDNVRISPSNLTADSLPLSGGTMTGDLNILKSGGGTIDLKQYAFPQGVIKFSSDSGYTPFEIKGEANPGATKLALRNAPAGAMQDSFVVSSFSGSGYNYSAVPLRIGANATANALDDYEEGTFDLQWGYGRFGGVSVYDLSDFGGTNKSETSTYVKVGRHVTVTSIFKWGSLPTAWTDTTALVYIILPFTVAEGYYGNGAYYMFPGSSAAGSPSLFPEGYGGTYRSMLGFHKSTFGFSNNWQTLQVGDLPTPGSSGYVELRLSFSFYTTD